MMPRNVTVRPGSLSDGIFTFRVTGTGPNTGFRYLVRVPQERVYDEAFFEQHAEEIRHRLSKFREDYGRDEVQSDEPSSGETS
jgi:hypothetical protein